MATAPELLNPPPGPAPEVQIRPMREDDVAAVAAVERKIPRSAWMLSAWSSASGE